MHIECVWWLLTTDALVCDQERNGCAFIDLRALFKLYRASLTTAYATSITSTRSGDVPTLDGSAALVWVYGNETGESVNDPFASPRGVAFDDTSNELFVSDQLHHRVKVYQFSPVALADLLKSTQSSSLSQKQQLTLLKKTKRYTPPVVFSRAFGSKGHGRGQLQCPSGLDVSHYHVIVCDVGNSRLAVFAKRGNFVRSIGSKGTGACEFHDPRDVKLVNVRKVRGAFFTGAGGESGHCRHLTLCEIPTAWIHAARHLARSSA